MRNRCPMRGFTLPEVIVAMGIMSVSFTLGAVYFHETLQLRGAHERYLARQNAAEFLLRGLANDVRAARGFAASQASAGAAEDAGVLALRAATGRIVYRAGGGRVARFETTASGIEKTVMLDMPEMRVRFDFEGAPPDKARTAVVTVEWDESPRVGIEHPILSVRLAPRGAVHE